MNWTRGSGGSLRFAGVPASWRVRTVPNALFSRAYRRVISLSCSEPYDERVCGGCYREVWASALEGQNRPDVS
ncbi:MAG: hypothetical protein ACLU4J_16570 [Butyricimonas paravirosa]